MQDHIDNLTLQQLKDIRKELGMSEEKTLPEEIIDENYFFMKDNRRAVLSTQIHTKKNIANFLDYLSEQPTQTIHDFYNSVAEVTYHINGSKGSHVLIRDILYFYNKAIPVEYKTRIFSYKRVHKETMEINQDVVDAMNGLTDKLKAKKESLFNSKK